MKTVNSDDFSVSPDEGPLIQLARFVGKRQGSRHTIDPTSNLVKVTILDASE